MEEANGLFVHAGAAASATPIDYCWTVAGSFAKSSFSSQIQKPVFENIFVFPNPADNKINVALDNSNMLAVNWEITDIAGKKMKTGKANLIKGDRIQIAVDGLKNGIYQMRVGNGLQMRSKRFVIAR